MKALKVLETICGIVIVFGVVAIIGLFGSIENDYATLVDIIPYLIAGIVIVGIACLGLRYVEAKEEYIVRRNRRRY